MMESPASGGGFGFIPPLNHRLRNCALLSKFGDPPPTSPPPSRFGDTAGCEEAPIEHLGGETQVLVDESEFCDKERARLVNLDGETQVVDHLDDGYQTCVMNLVGETQVLDGYGEETQVDCGDDDMCCQETQQMHLGGETEVQDDEECVRNVYSKFLRNGTDCDFTGTESGTVRDLFCDVTTSLVDEKKLGHSHCKPLEQGSENFSATPPSTVEVDPGYFQRSFTSIRAASLRASGLAARCKALDETRNTSSHALVEKEHEISCAAQTSGSVHNHDMADVGTCETVCSVSRKLFTEVHIENLNYSNEIDGEEEAKTPQLHLPDNDDEVAGLSYVDSQEPGDSTQADALDFIERFVKENASDLQLDVRSEPPRRKTSKPATCVKSFSNVSKKTTTFCRLVDQPVSFDWDEELEDDGGGEFFCRLKEKILNESGQKQRSLPQPKKSRRCGKLLGDKADRLKFQYKSTAIQSDSKLQLLKNRKASVLDTVEANIKRNLQMELNPELSARCVEEPTEAASCKRSTHEIFSIGPDTQIALEAMEVLFCGEPVSGNDVNANQGNLASLSNLAVAKSTSTAKVLELEKKTPSDGLAIRKSKRKHNENKNVHNYGTRCTVDVENEVNETSSVENIKHTNEEVLPSVAPRRATRSMVLNQSSVLLNQADVAISKDVNIETNFQVGVVIPKGKRSRKYARHQSAFKDTSVGTHSNAGEVKVGECVVHEVSTSDVKTSSAEANSRRQRTSRHLNSRLIKPGDHDKLKTTKVANKGLLRLTCNEGSAANRSVESCPDAVNSNREVSRKDISNHHSAKGSGVDVADCSMPVEMTGTVLKTDKLTQRRVKPVKASFTAPDNNSAVDNARMGRSCRRQLPINLSRESLRKEISALLSNSQKSLSDLQRKRREMTEVQILFSNHLDADVIKHQKKILARLGASLAFSISDATHFVADSFVRTRNMLEAIASGKPVVTHLWLESCNQTNCLMDEKAYILRDAKKERELGFSMPDSIVHASRQPLLQNQKVIITPNVMPSKDIVATLVKAVHGRVVGNFNDSSVKVDKFPDNVLVLSCVEDYLFCQPFLNEGLKVYNSELLLSGIVTQRLDFARHRLFDDHVQAAVSRRSRRSCR